MVKLHWDTEELIENWTLLPTELELVNKKVGANQLGFAILLKYFQLMARFPDSTAEARIQKYQAQNSVERRKKETRKKILLGAWVQHKINNGDWTEEYILKEMDSYLTKKVDRRIFDLPVLSDRDNEGKGSDGEPQQS